MKNFVCEFCTFMLLIFGLKDSLLCMNCHLVKSVFCILPLDCVFEKVSFLHLVFSLLDCVFMVSISALYFPDNLWQCLDVQ